MIAEYLKEISLKVLQSIHYAVLLDTECCVLSLKIIKLIASCLHCCEVESHLLKTRLTAPFLLFDSVHLLKCIRNYWINRADMIQALTFSDFNKKTLIQKTCLQI